MRIAISNIAWDPAEDEDVAQLLRRYKIDAIDVAPGKYFPDPSKATDDEIAHVKRVWSDRGFEITGMQALLFGTSGLNLFGTAEVQQAMLAHLKAVCRIGAGLGATRLVFGSPKNRDCSGLSDAQAITVALPFFQRLGEIAASYGVIICLEPNPPCYGANFMTTGTETAAIVTQVAHPAIFMQFDSGAFTINGEDPCAILKNHTALIGHIHASEPDLIPLGDSTTDHSKIAPVLAQVLPEYVVTIEMLATKNEPHQVAIERALRVAIQHYRSAGNT